MVLKASVVVDYYAMVAYATVGGAADCTTVAVVVVVAVLIGVARCGNNVMLLSQVLLQDELVIGFQGDRREHHAGADGRRK